MTYSDPKAYAKPWTIRWKLALAAGTELLEYVCAENEKDRPHLVGKASDESKNAVSVAPEILSKYAGAYEFLRPVAVQVNVELSGTQLTVDFDGKEPLTPLSETMFSSASGARMRFVLNEQGAVTHLVLSLVEGEIMGIRKK